jgi:glyoxylase-like metal-dependent hydrolase (beta-lactamase superfamily II)
MSLDAVEAERAMGARIIPFFEKVTETFSYLVIDPPTQAAAIIDPVLDYDPAAGRIRTHSADGIAKMVQAEGLRVEWILETHVHADHLSAAGYLKKKLGGALGIGSKVQQVQRILGNLFNDKPAIPPGAGFDHLFEDGETFRVGTLDVKALDTPGHTPADMSYMLEDAVFAGDTLFMPDYGTARCDFPGGDARTLYRSIQRLLELPPQTRLFMCHDYAPGGRAYAFETTVANERAQNVHAHHGVTEDALVEQRTARDATLDTPRLFLPSLWSICAPANCRRPNRTAGVISRSRSRLQLFDFQRSVARSYGSF